MHDDASEERPECIKYGDVEDVELKSARGVLVHQPIRTQRKKARLLAGGRPIEHTKKRNALRRHRMSNLGDSQWTRRATRS